MNMTHPTRSCALVLAGALGRGAFEAGVIHAIIERGIRPTAIFGTSSGALNGLMLFAAMARGDVADAGATLSELWVQEASIVRLALRSTSLRGILERRGLLSQKHLLSLMRRYAPPVDDPVPGLRFETVVAPLEGTPIWANGGPHRTYEKVLRFTSDDLRPGAIERVYRTVAASAAFPFLFTPVHLQNLGPCVDGGAVNNAPLSAAPDSDRIILVSATPAYAPTPPPRLAGIPLAVTLSQILIEERLVRDLQRAPATSEILEIRPVESLPGGPLSSLGSIAARREMVDVGHARATEVLRSDRTRSGRDAFAARCR